MICCMLLVYYKYVMIYYDSTRDESSHDSESTKVVEWPSLLMKTHPSLLKDAENEVTTQTTGLVVCHIKTETINKHIPSAPTTSHNGKLVLA